MDLRSERGRPRPRKPIRQTGRRRRPRSEFSVLLATVNSNKRIPMKDTKSIATFSDTANAADRVAQIPPPHSHEAGQVSIQADAGHEAGPPSNAALVAASDECLGAVSFLIVPFTPPQDTRIITSVTRIWSAVTCHRFFCFGDRSPKQGRVQRPEMQPQRPPPFDGDESPAKSADESAHSKTSDCGTATK